MGANISTMNSAVAPRIRFSGVPELKQMFQLTVIQALSAEQEARLADEQDIFDGEARHQVTETILRERAEKAQQHRMAEMFHRGALYMGLQAMFRDEALGDFMERLGETVMTPFRVDPTVGDSRAEGTRTSSDVDTMSVRDLLQNPAHLFSRLSPDNAKEAFLALMLQMKKGADGVKAGATSLGGDTFITPFPHNGPRGHVPWLLHVINQLYPPVAGKPDKTVAQYFLQEPHRVTAS